MKEIQSFRFDGWTTGAIANAAESLDVTRTEVVELAVQAFVQFGIADQLETINASSLPGGYSEVIAKVVYETDVMAAIKELFDESFDA